MKRTWIVTFLALRLVAQNAVVRQGSSPSGDVDFSTAKTTKPVRTGGTLPNACTANELFFLTSVGLHQCVKGKFSALGNGGTWGTVGGAIAAQTDLWNTLQGKQPMLKGTQSQYVRGDGSLASLASSATTDTTDASKISSGTLPPARLPNPTTSTIGGLYAAPATAHQWLSNVDTSGQQHFTQPDAGDLTTTAPGGVLRTQADKNSENISVKDFGAVGGAGTTDDTTAFQSAINKAASVGACLYIPVGLYKVTHLTIPAPSGANNTSFCMRGEGSPNVTKSGSSTTPNQTWGSVIWCTSTSSDCLPLNSTIMNSFPVVKLENFSVVGPDSVTSTTSHNGVSITGPLFTSVPVVSVKDVYVSHFGGGVGFWADNTEDSVYINVRGFWNGTGLKFTNQSNATSCIHCSADANHEYGIYIDTMYGSTFISPLIQSNDKTGLFATGLHNLTFISPYFENNNWTNAAGKHTIHLYTNGTGPGGNSSNQNVSMINANACESKAEVIKLENAGYPDSHFISNFSFSGTLSGCTTPATLVSITPGVYFTRILGVPDASYVSDGGFDTKITDQFTGEEIGNKKITGNLGVTGATTLTGNAAITGTLYVHTPGPVTAVLSGTGVNASAISYLSGTNAAGGLNTSFNHQLNGVDKFNLYHNTLLGCWGVKRAADAPGSPALAVYEATGNVQVLRGLNLGSSMGVDPGAGNILAGGLAGSGSASVYADLNGKLIRGSLLSTTTSIVKGDGSGGLAAATAVDVATLAASSSAPLMSGIAAAGSSSTLARADHVHPADTTRAPVGDVTSAGTVTRINGASVPVSQSLASTNSSGQFVAGPTLPLTPANGGLGTAQNVPAHLRFLGDGSDGAVNCAGNISGVKYATTFTVANGSTCTANAALNPVVVYATGACTLAGTLNARGGDGGNTATGDGGGSGGGGGGGTATGVAGSSSSVNGLSLASTGVAGTSSGGTGGNGNPVAAVLQRYPWTAALGWFKGGATGGSGGSGGGAGGRGGQAVLVVCASINFTGTIDSSGQVGGASTGNNIGAGGGGGGGYVWLIGRDSVLNTGMIAVTGGTGGSCGAYTTCGGGGAGGAGWSKVVQMQ